MSGNRNYFLDDITVCNDMTKDEIAMYGCIPMTEFGEKMFIHDYSAEGNRADKRGNLRYDAGYTGMNQTDRGVVPGMNFPCRLIGPSRQAGIGDDATFEHTLYKAGCLVMKLSDSICSRHPKPSTAMGQYAFGDDDRNRLFGVRWAEKLGIHSLQNLSRFDGMSCFGTGETIDYRVIKTERHVDEQNAREEGEDRCPTLTMIVAVEIGEGVTILARVGINLYKKNCCTAAYRRLRVNKDILSVFLQSQPMKSTESMPLHERFRRPRFCYSKRRFWTYQADDDKEGHLSLYVNALNRLAIASDNDRGVMIEALYTMAFTPSGDGWRCGFDRTLAQFIDGGGRLDKNFGLAYFDNMIDQFGSVSGGTVHRCQVSHKGVISVEQYFQSCWAIHSSLVWADECNDTTRIVWRMSSSLRNGGIHNVGEFYSQLFLNVSCKTCLMKNVHHAGNISLSVSTTTYKRLKLYGVRSRAHAAEIIPYLAAHTGMRRNVCENRLCECLRKQFGNDGARDVFFDGDVLYRINVGRVWVVNYRGEWTEEVFLESKFDVTNSPGGFAWWMNCGMSEGEKETWEGESIVLKKRKH
jgi:hypothetical protein